MLYKNDELYRLTPADHKEIKQRFPKFPIRLTYPENRIKESPSKHNRLPDKPNTISFPLVATVKTKTGTERWVYCENRIIGTDGRVRYTPPVLKIRSAITLQETDVELIYWLINACPHLEGGKNFNGRVAKCVIEDLRGEAEKKAAKEEMLATMKGLIYSDKVGLGETKLRQVAKAYFIKGVDELTFAQVKLAVENEIRKDQIEGVQKFMDLVEAEQAIGVKATIQKAIDMEAITYMDSKRTWAWKTGQGKKNEPICVIAAGMNPGEALYDYYMGDQQFAKQLLSAVQGKTVSPVGVGAEVAGPEED
jgi:hypothetical protein